MIAGILRNVFFAVLRIPPSALDGTGCPDTSWGVERVPSWSCSVFLKVYSYLGCLFKMSDSDSIV